MLNYFHPDGQPCLHKRCKRRQTARYHCDQLCGELIDVGATYARFDAEKAGWVIQANGESYCPACARQSWGRRDAKPVALKQAELFPVEEGGEA